MKRKTFDCVQMMHQGGEKILREIEGMTPREETEYWRQRTQDLRDHQRELQAQRAPGVPGTSRRP